MLAGLNSYILKNKEIKYNLYSEEAINEIEKRIKNISVKVWRKTIKMLRFADDIAMLANTEGELEALNVTKIDFNNYNMKINIGKTSNSM